MRGLQRIVGGGGRRPCGCAGSRGRMGAHLLALVVLLQPRLVGDEDVLRVGVASLEERVEQLDMLAHRRLHRIRVAEAEGIVRHDGDEAVPAIHAGPAQRTCLRPLAGAPALRGQAPPCPRERNPRPRRVEAAADAGAAER